MPASAVPASAVLSVNAETYGTQGGARVARLSDGGYVVVWVNHDAQGPGSLPSAANAASDIRMRLFNASGTARGDEIAVNAASRGWQVDPDVAVTADGRIAVTWTDGWGFFAGADHPGSGSGGDGAADTAVRLRLFGGGGLPLGPEMLVNQTTANQQQDPAVVALQDGRVLVAWEDWSLSCSAIGCGGGPGIKARLYAAGGPPLDSEMAWTGDWNYAPAPVALAGGGWAAIWVSAYYQDPAQLRVRLHDAAGAALDTEHAYATGGGAGAQWSAAALRDGGMALAWTQRNAAIGDGSGKGIHLQWFRADGTPDGSTVVANTTRAADQENVRVAALGDGGLVAAWESFTPPDAQGLWTRQLRAQVFDAQGVPRGSEQLVEGNDASLKLDDLVALDGGGFALAWTGRSWVDVHVRAYGSDGLPLGETAIAHGSGGVQSQARLVALDGGAFAVTWAGAYDGYNDGGDGSAEGLHTRVFVTRGLDLKGTALADRLADSPLDDRIAAASGNDVISCRGGHDVVDGGAGVDTLVLPVPLSDVLANLPGWALGPAGPVAGTTSVVSVELSGIERIRLDDALFAFDTQPSGKTWQSAALYHAGFGALPTRTELSRWTAVADDSADMAALASAMLSHYLPGGVGNADLVAYLYTRLTGQTASAADVNVYAGQIGTGRTWESQGELFAWAASLSLNSDAMWLAPDLPFVGSVQALDPSFWPS